MSESSGTPPAVEPPAAYSASASYGDTLPFGLHLVTGAMNALGTLWNMVGFQTKLKHGAQTEIFRMIPGLENAEFVRFGMIHRNTYVNAPEVSALYSRPHALWCLCPLLLYWLSRLWFRAGRGAVHDDPVVDPVGAASQI